MNFSIAVADDLNEVKSAVHVAEVELLVAVGDAADDDLAKAVDE